MITQPGIQPVMMGGFEKLNSEFQALAVEYDPVSLFCKQLEGAVLPDTTPAGVKRLNQGQPWETWGGIRLSTCRCFYVLPDGRKILKTTMKRILKVNDFLHRSLVPLVSIPNGQVKNYLNACRGANMSRDQDRIAIIGSKAAEGGGIWHQYFILYLMLTPGKRVVDFYDFSEREEVKVWSSETAFVSAEWIPMGFSDEMKEEYDIIIDDTWSYTTGPGLLTDFAGHYSKKGGTEITGSYVPFLHATETRQFSTKPRQGIEGGCLCPTCRVIKQCVDNYEQYLFVRHMCSRLGYNATCRDIPLVSEQDQIGQMLKKILTNPEVEIRVGQMIRSVMCVSEEIGLEVTGKTVKQGGEAHFIPLNRYKMSRESDSAPHFPWLEGKKVLFCGIPSTILGSTKINYQLSSANPLEADVIILNSLDTWLHQMVGDVVYCPSPPSKVAAVMPDWVATTRRVGTLHEYVRIAPAEKNKVQIPRNTYSALQKWNPKLRSDPQEGLKFYSVSLGLKPKLEPLNMGQWRESIYVNSDGSWGRMIKALRFLTDQPGLMDLSIKVPWDITEEEIEDLDEPSMSNHLRKKVRKIWEIKDYMYLVKDKIRLCEYMQKQGEFLVIKPFESSSRIQRTETAHPWSFVHVNQEVRAEMAIASQLSYLQGFYHMKEFLQHVYVGT